MAIDTNTSPATAFDGVTTTGSGQTTQERVKQQALGQDDFFKLLTTQLASQDPLQPMEDTAFIAQMASFSELEMTSQLTKSFDEFTSVQQFSAAQGIIGKDVALVDGGVYEGTVTSIERQNGQTIAFLDGKVTGHDIGTIFAVSMPGGYAGGSGDGGTDSGSGNTDSGSGNTDSGSGDSGSGDTGSEAGTESSTTTEG